VCDVGLQISYCFFLGTFLCLFSIVPKEEEEWLGSESKAMYSYAIVYTDADKGSNFSDVPAVWLPSDFLDLVPVGVSPSR
jgi:hypothetical protein